MLVFFIYMILIIAKIVKTPYATHFGPPSVSVNGTLGMDYFQTNSQQSFIITSCEFQYDEEITGVQINAEVPGKINLTVTKFKYAFFFLTRCPIVPIKIKLIIKNVKLLV